MKQFCLLLFISSMLFSCGNTATQQDGTISIFNNVSFIINENEKIVENTKDLQEEYEKHLQLTQKDISIPLFKNIVHPDYQIQIGIPFNTNLEELKQLYTNQSLSKNINKDNYNFKQLEKDGIYYSMLVQKTPRNYIYLLASTSSEDIHKQQLNEANLTKRILIQEE